MDIGESPGAVLRAWASTAVGKGRINPRAFAELKELIDAMDAGGRAGPVAPGRPPSVAGATPRSGRAARDGEGPREAVRRLLGQLG
jgi:hypothetical protein